jgi:hypothetical protein
MDYTALRESRDRLRTYQRNLYHSKQKKANYVINIPIDIIREIENAEKSIIEAFNEINRNIVALLKEFIRENTVFEQSGTNILADAYYIVTEKALRQEFSANILDVIIMIEDSIDIGPLGAIRFAQLVFEHVEEPLKLQARAFLSRLELDRENDLHQLLSDLGFSSSLLSFQKIREQFAQYRKTASRIYIVLEPAPLDRQRFTVKLYDMVGENIWPDEQDNHTEDCSHNAFVIDEEHGCTLPCIRQRLKQFYNKAKLDQGIRIELFVPKHLLCADFHAWELFNDDDDDCPYRFGVHWDLVVRSWERLELHEVPTKRVGARKAEYEAWVAASRLLKEPVELREYPRTQAPSEGVDTVRGGDPSKIVGVYKPRSSDQYRDVAEHIRTKQVRCFIETYPPPPDKARSQQVASIVAKGLVSGVWLTDDTDRSDYQYDALDQRLQLQYLKELPATFRYCFRREDVDTCLVLFWDDADYLPPYTYPEYSQP